MKKVNALILGLAILLAFSCGSEEKKDDPTPQIPLQNSCQVIKQVGAETTSDFTYNSSGKVIRVDHIRPNNPANNFYQLMTYNAAGNMAEIKFYDSNNVQDMRQTYTYNASNLPDTIAYYYQFAQTSYSTFEYNATGKLIKRNSFNPQTNSLISYTNITYPAPAQSKEETYSKNASGNMVLSSTLVKQYDNKKNPYTLLPYLDERILISPNNVTSYNQTNHINGTGTNYVNTYTYNTQDFPTQQTLTVNGQQNIAATWTYNCQ